MKKYIYLWCILCLVFSTRFLQAQSFHVTQYPSLQPFLNPAADNNSYESRMKMFYRSQWRKLGNPYVSYGASYVRGFRHYQIGLTGVQNQIDKGISQTQIGLSQAFNMHIDHDDLLTVGAQFGVLQRNLSNGSFTFGSQFDKLTNTYDPSISSGENINNQTLVKPTLAAGAYWRHDAEDATMYTSLSMAYLNRPQQNFTNTEDKMFVKTAAQMGVNFRFGHNMYIDPNILYVRQRDSYLLNLCFNTHHRITEEMVASVGVGYRKNDAFLFTGGLAYNDFVLGASYDVNLSPLTTYTNGRGAFELSLSYRIKHRDPHIMVKDTSVEMLEHKHKHIKHPTHHPSHHHQKKNAPVKDNSLIHSKKDTANHKSTAIVAPTAVPKYYVKDTDGDGISDSLDQCPTIKGKIEHLGCPDNTPDRDKDGVPDEIDVCPDVFGAVASAGCPLSKGKIWELFQKEPHLSDILFDVNSAALSPKYHYTLDTIATHLKKYEYLILMICGHSDKSGNSSYNLQLSKLRADAIEEYLMKKGVPRRQLNFFYYGDSKPKKGNVPDEGNRRVELFYTE